MVHRVSNIFGKVFLSINVDSENKIIHAIWEGYLSEANIKAGALAFLDTLKETGISCMLSNMLGMMGSVSASKWAATEWAPQAAKAGLKYLALLKAPDAIANPDVANFHITQTFFQSKVFNNKEEAIEWLLEQGSTRV